MVNQSEIVRGEVSEWRPCYRVPEVCKRRPMPAAPRRPRPQKATTARALATVTGAPSVLIVIYVGCGERTSKRGGRHREVRLHVHRRPVGVARRGGGSGSAIGISRRRSRPCGGISTGGRPECRWEAALRTQPISHARWPPRRVALGLRPRGPRATRGTRRWRGAPGRRRDGDGEWG